MKRKGYYFPVIVLFIICTLLSLGYGQLEVGVTTKTYYGGHTPENVVAIWIQTPDTVLVKTLGIWGMKGNQLSMAQKLRDYILLSGGNVDKVDCITAATRETHDEPLEVTWNFIDKDGEWVPYGTYEFWVELSESDYFWTNPDSEPYFGRISYGSIELEKEGKTIYGDTSDTCFSAFSATYTSMNTIYLGQKKYHNPVLSYKYNPVSQQLIVTLESIFNRPAVLYITNLKGEVIKNIRFNGHKLRWNGRNKNGDPVPSGVYLLDVRIEGNRLGPVRSFTLLR